MGDEIKNHHTAKSFYKQIDAARRSNYPQNGPDADDYAGLYREDSPRVAKCMWIGTGFWEYLSNHVDMEDYKLAKPVSKSGYEYDLGFQDQVPADSRIKALEVVNA